MKSLISSPQVTLVPVVSGGYNILGLPFFKGNHFADKVWCKMSDLQRVITPQHGKMPRIGSFRPEYLFANPPRMNWVELSEHTQSATLVVDADIVDCPFHTLTEERTLLLDMEWAEEVLSLTTQGIFAFVCRNRVMLNSGETVPYHPGRNYHRYDVALAA
jgi:hypothetical protein